jgi:hypothetical protein
MRDHASSNANGNFTKSTIVKAGSTYTSPKMVQLPPLIDLQSSLPLSIRPRILSLEFHVSPRPPLPRTPLLSRKLSKKQVTPDSMNLELTFCTRPNVPDAHAVRALEFAPSLLPSAFDAKLSLQHPRQSNDEMCFTPAPTFERDVSMSDPPALEREESRILHSPTMPRELFVPDDF